MWTVTNQSPSSAIGAERVEAVTARAAKILEWSRKLQGLTLKAWELGRTTLADLEGASQDEEWLFVSLTDGTAFGTDEVSDLGRLRPAAGVFYPELDSRLWAWWITHAWLATELTIESAKAIPSWSLASAAPLTRSLMETVAAFSYEARQLGDRWRTAKTFPGGAERPLLVRQEMNTQLLRAFRGTRLKGAPDVLHAPNVLTWIDRLGWDTKNENVLKWYEHLSEAAHPSFFARTLYASVQMRHETGAKFEAFYSRNPLGVSDHSGAEDPATEVVYNDFPRQMVDCWLFSTEVLLELLPLEFRIPADFSLTSQARRLAAQDYLIGMWESPGKCPCGCNGSIIHRWGKGFPLIKLTARP